MHALRSKAAEKKKKQKLAKREQESQTKAAVQAHEAAGMTAAAVMLDLRARREAQELAELDNIPPSDEENLSGAFRFTPPNSDSIACTIQLIRSHVY